MEYLEANGTYLSRSSVRTHPPLRGPLPRGDRLRSNNFHEVPSLEGCPKGGVGFGPKRALSKCHSALGQTPRSRFARGSLNKQGPRPFG